MLRRTATARGGARGARIAGSGCASFGTTKDGRTLAHQTMAAKGSFENPLTREEEEEKALDLIAPVLGKRRSDQLLAALWNFDKLKDVRELRKLYWA